MQSRRTAAGGARAGAAPPDFTELFSKKADIYDVCRPRYALRAFDELKAAGVLVPSMRAADVGCGTGIFTRQLACALGAGSEVVGVEPNDAMRRRAEELSAQEAAPREGGEADAEGRAALRFVRGSAEDTGLAHGSVDVVAAAQAFHWFQPDAFRRECRRILNGGEGFVVLAWNVKQVGPLDADRKRIVERYRALLDVYHCSWDERRAGIARFFAGAFEHRSFDNPLMEDWSAFITRTLSASHALSRDDARFGEYVGAWRAFFDENASDGVLATPNRTEVYFGRIS